MNDRITSTLERHAEATDALVALGTNDAGGTTPVDPGLGCSGSACSGTFKGNMQALINAIDDSNKIATVALVPPRFGDKVGTVPYTNPLTHPKNQIVQQYNQVILNELTKHQIGPDLFDFFLGSTNRFSLFADNLHPNALGTVLLASLWQNAITGETVLPYFLDNVCVRKTQGGACEKPLLYKQNLLEVGDQYYVDRTFTLQNSIPTEVKDGRWLMTADDDKNLSNSDYLSFNTSQTAAVYVAYDAAAAAIPNWLTAFSPLGIQLQTNNGSSPLLNVYKWDNVIGDVELGGADAVSTGARTNYLVIVVPK